MTLLFLYAEPLPFWQGMLMIAAIFAGTILLIAVGGYIFVRVIATVFNSYQNNWEGSAKPLGLTVDKTAGGLYKPLVGERNGWRISVTHFSINPRTSSAGVVSVDHCAQVEVLLRHPLGFSLTMSRRETFIARAIAHVFDDSDEAGHQDFDKVFKIECSDLDSLRSILAFEFKDSGSPTLLMDLLHAAKKYPRVILTDKSLSLGVEAYFGEAQLIEPVVAEAIKLVGRIETAASVA